MWNLIFGETESSSSEGEEEASPTTAVVPSTLKKKQEGDREVEKLANMKQQPGLHTAVGQYISIAKMQS